jgi:hypothetical protein
MASTCVETHHSRVSNNQENVSSVKRHIATSRQPLSTPVRLLHSFCTRAIKWNFFLPMAAWYK